MTQSIPASASHSSQTLPPNAIFPEEELWSDEPPLESDRHRDQIDFLIRLLKGLWQQRSDFYVTGNLTIYYSPNQKKSEASRGPDFFVVLGTKKRDRRSWVVWQEGNQYPNVIIELLSDSTEKIDKGIKKQIYQDTFRTPEYFWFHPDTLEFRGFRLVDGRYQDLQPTVEGWLWSEQLGLYLGLHHDKLRFFTPEKQLVLLPEESANQQLEQTSQQLEQTSQQLEQTSQQLEQTSQQLEQERLRAERLVERLRAAGLDPDQL